MTWEPASQQNQTYRLWCLKLLQKVSSPGRHRWRKVENLYSVNINVQDMDADETCSGCVLSLCVLCQGIAPWTPCYSGSLRLISTPKTLLRTMELRAVGTLQIWFLPQHKHLQTFMKGSRLNTLVSLYQEYWWWCSAVWLGLMKLYFYISVLKLCTNATKSVFSHKEYLHRSLICADVFNLNCIKFFV